jgi:hypothetical protein
LFNKLFLFPSNGFAQACVEAWNICDFADDVIEWKDLKAIKKLKAREVQALPL